MYSVRWKYLISVVEWLSTAWKPQIFFIFGGSMTSIPLRKRPLCHHCISNMCITTSWLKGNTAELGITKLFQMPWEHKISRVFRAVLSVCVGHRCSTQFCSVNSKCQHVAMYYYLSESVLQCTRTKYLDKSKYHNDTAWVHNAVKLLRDLKSLRNCGHTVRLHDLIFFEIALSKSKLIYPS